MEICVEPSGISKHPQFKDENIINCPICSSILDKRVETERRCTYDASPDKPFVSPYSDSWSGRQSVWEDQDILHIRCNTCYNCNTCHKRLDTRELSAYNWTGKCSWCTWTSSSPQEKLSKYGLVKLKILAKKKGIKRYSTFNKTDLLIKLKPCVTNADFPIR